MKPDDLAESWRLMDYQPMLSRLCILLVALWLAPPLLVNPKSAYRKYKQNQPVRVRMFGLWLRMISQPEEEQKLGIEIPKH